MKLTIIIYSVLLIIIDAQTGSISTASPGCDLGLSADVINICTSQTSSDTCEFGASPTGASSTSSSPLYLDGLYHPVYAAGCLGPTGTGVEVLACQGTYTSNVQVANFITAGYNTGQNVFYPIVPGHYMVIASGLACRIGGEVNGHIRIRAVGNAVSSGVPYGYTNQCVADYWRSVQTTATFRFDVVGGSSYIFVEGLNLYNNYPDSERYNRLSIFRSA